MSQAITKVVGIQHGFERIATIVPFSIAFTAETYATASGGITVDLSTLIGLQGTGTSQQLCVNDIVHSFGFYSGGDTVVPATPTKSSGIPTGAINIRLFNGETETADAAKTGTLTLFVLFGQGSRSYNT